MKRRALFVATVLIALTTAEAVARFILPAPITTAYPIWRIPGDDRALTLRPNLNLTLTHPDFTMHVRTDSEGVRLPRQGQSGIVAFGDSQTFGYGVEGWERWTDGLGALNLGYTGGTSPVDYVVALKHLREIPRVVLVGLFPENDYDYDVEHRDFAMDRNGDIPYVTLKHLTVRDGYLVTDQPSIPLKKWAWMHSALYRAGSALRPRAQGELPWVLTHSEPDFYHTMMFHSLRQMHKWLTPRGSRLVVVHLPSSIQVAARYDRFYAQGYGLSGPFDDVRATLEPQRTLKPLFDSLGIVYIDPTEALRQADRDRAMYFAHDGHFTVAGHQVVGGVVEAALESWGL